MRDAQWALKFSAPRKYQLQALKHIEAVSSLAGVTEAVGLLPLPGWECYGGESKILWREEIWTLQDKGRITLETPKWERGGAVMDHLTIPYVYLTNNYKKNLHCVRAVGHHPAHLYDPAQHAANESVLDQLEPEVLNKLRMKFAPQTHYAGPAVVINYGADFNKNFNNRADYAEIRKAVQNPHLVQWEIIEPNQPTHGKRTIDGVITNSEEYHQEMLPRVRYMDHRGFAFRVRP